jgi:rod shape determining protein RodA
MDLKRSFKNLTRSLSLYFKEIDLSLFIVTLLLAAFSIFNLAGIVGLESPMVKKQAIVALVGLVVMVLCSFFNYRSLKNYTLPVMILYSVSVALLVMTLFFPAIRNIHAWIIIGGFTFEPSEIAKLALIVVLAKYFSQRHIHINQIGLIVVSGIYLAILAGIILLQPDLGSASILVLIWFGILMAAGINRKQFFALVILGLSAAYLAWIFALKPYQKERLASFINPYKDPTGIGYNIIQSQIAIGSGGWFGSGWGNGSQATLGFLPEPHNDFVFAAMVEQFGFVGSASFLATIVFVLWRALAIGEASGNNFGKLFSIGFMIFIWGHTFITTGFNIGLLPITGIPFAFLSYGGSNFLAIMIGLGTLQSIKRYG